MTYYVENYLPLLIRHTFLLQRIGHVYSVKLCIRMYEAMYTAPVDSGDWETSGNRRLIGLYSFIFPKTREIACHRAIYR